MSQIFVHCVVPFVEIAIDEAPVFVQVADGRHAPRALCTKVEYTEDRKLVLALDPSGPSADRIVLVRDGRYALPLLEARAGRHWELTLAAPWGERILLQFDRAGTQTAPPPEEGDGAVAAC